MKRWKRDGVREVFMSKLKTGLSHTGTEGNFFFLFSSSIAHNKHTLLAAAAFLACGESERGSIACFSSMVLLLLYKQSILSPSFLRLCD